VRILVADDEQPARSRLIRLIGDLGAPYQVVGEAADGNEAVRRAQELQADLVLLDIRMPGRDGLDAAGELSAMKHAPAVIFTTAYEAHALEAFARNAADYLLKPIRRERLASALERVARPTRPQLVSMTQDSKLTGHNICVTHRGDLQRVPLSHVLYLRADNKYVVVAHQGGEDLCDLSLKALEEEYGDLLLRIHRNSLVPRHRILGLVTVAGKPRLQLKGSDETLEISRRHLAEIRQFLKTADTLHQDPTP
jgi:two-component system response regulator AlgR